MDSDNIRNSCNKILIHNWNYPVVFTEVLNRHGLQLENVRGDFDPNHNIITGTEDQHKRGRTDSESHILEIQ